MDAPALRPFPDRWTTDPRTGWRMRGYAVGDRRYDVAVALPCDSPPAGGFPLLLVMDGALHFDAAACAAAALARRAAKTSVSPMVVAGIASGTGWSHDPARRGVELVPGTAAAGRLLALVRDRIVPDVAGLVPIDCDATAILGHSLGGLFALEALATGLVRQCVAISPSLWRLPDLVDRVAKTVTGRDARLLLVRGELEPAMVPGLEDVARVLAGAAAVSNTTIADEDHGSVAFAALPAALRFLHGGRPPA